MQKKHKLSLFVFRRDLRLDDNTGLLKALEESTLVIPCFIFDTRQVEEHPYKSDNALQFMLESIEDLKKQLVHHKANLYLFYGKAEDIINDLCSSLKINAVYVNQDYTPFSKKRDQAIEQVCKKNNITFYQEHDLLLNPPEQVTKKDGKPYTIFTPFFKQASIRPIKLPMPNKLNNFFTENFNPVFTHNINYQPSPDIFLTGGRQEALKLLQQISDHKQYDKKHNIPALPTTHLSPHLKFGTISIREAHYAITKQLGSNSPIIRQLYWRDFYTTIAWWFPHVFGHAFKKNRDTIPWSSDKKNFKRWCDGLTGFPIVDAGMRELNETGFMHNRVRMITASFLVKDLGINWQWGEKYFATKLIDYDPCVNNGNWQWVASTGCDAQPYFRIFNPWLQQKKFDPACIYIKKWIPEFKNVPATIIHQLWKKSITDYPAPMIHHQEASLIVKNWFKKGS